MSYALTLGIGILLGGSIVFYVWKQIAKHEEG